VSRASYPEIKIPSYETPLLNLRGLKNPVSGVQKNNFLGGLFNPAASPYHEQEYVNGTAVNFTDMVLDSQEYLTSSLENKTLFQYNFGQLGSAPENLEYELCWSGKQVLLSPIKFYGPIAANLRTVQKCASLQLCAFTLQGDFDPVLEDAPPPFVNNSGGWVNETMMQLLMDQEDDNATMHANDS
jgi:hypothetical protein